MAATAMQPSRALELITSNDPGTTVISLAGNSTMQINPLKYGPQILAAMATNKTVTSLDLSNCGLPTSVGTDVAAMLKVNKTLQKLSLESNKINAEGVELILAAIEFNSTLVEINLLNVGHTRVGESALTALCDALEKNVTLINVIWRLDSRQAWKITKLLSRNKEIARRLSQGKSVDDIHPLINPDSSSSSIPSSSSSSSSSSQQSVAAKTEAEVKAKAEAEAKNKAEAEAKAKAEAETKAKAEAELKAKTEAEAKAKAEAEAKAKAEAEAKAKAEAELKAKTEAEAKNKAETEAKAKVEAEAKAALAARAEAEAEAKRSAAQAEAEKLQLEEIEMKALEAENERAKLQRARRDTELLLMQAEHEQLQLEAEARALAQEQERLAIQQQQSQLRAQEEEANALAVADAEARQESAAQKRAEAQKEADAKAAAATTAVGSPNRSPGGGAKADSGSNKCLTCGKQVYELEKLIADGKVFHKTGCFRCAHCNGGLSLGNYASLEGKYYCKPHFKQLFALKGNYAEGFGGQKPQQQWASKGSPVPSPHTPKQATDSPTKPATTSATTPTRQPAPASRAAPAAVAPVDMMTMGGGAFSAPPAAAPRGAARRQAGRVAGYPIHASVVAQVCGFLKRPAVIDTPGLFGAGSEEDAAAEALYGALLKTRGEVALEGAAPKAVAAALLKYLKQADPPIVPFRHYEGLLMAQQIAVPSRRVCETKALVDEFPASSRELLEAIVPMLKELIARSAQNGMTRELLSKLFAPCIIRNKPSLQLMDPTVAQSEALFCSDLIRWYDHLLHGGDPKNLNQADSQYQTERKRRTLQLFETAEVPDKFLLLDNRHQAVVAAVVPPPQPEGDQDPDQDHPDTEPSSSSPPVPGLSLTGSSSSSSLLSPRGTKISSKVQVSKTKTKKKLFHHAQTTYTVTFGTLSAQRTVNDFLVFRAFLVNNYPYVPLPALLHGGYNVKKEEDLSHACAAFLSAVTSTDEFFMDSLFVERWLQFVGSVGTPAKKK